MDSKVKRHMTTTSHPLANLWPLFNVPKSKQYFKQMKKNCRDKLENIQEKKKEKNEQEEVINKTNNKKIWNAREDAIQDQVNI